MNIIHITGLRYNWVHETDLDKANTLVEEKLRQLTWTRPTRWLRRN